MLSRCFDDEASGYFKIFNEDCAMSKKGINDLERAYMMLEADDLEGALVILIGMNLIPIYICYFFIWIKGEVPYIVTKFAARLAVKLLSNGRNVEMLIDSWAGCCECEARIGRREMLEGIFYKDGRNFEKMNKDWNNHTDLSDNYTEIMIEFFGELREVRGLLECWEENLGLSLGEFDFSVVSEADVGVV